MLSWFRTDLAGADDGDADQARPKELYEEDFYVWTQRQAELLRARKFEDLDLEHLIEEVAELGDTKLSAVLNNARVVMEHLLKLQHSPAIDPRSGWRAPCGSTVTGSRSS